MSKANRAYNGMTLRDYFAAKALGGILANPQVEKDRQDKLDGRVSDEQQRAAIARVSYIYADAMLKAREGQQ